MKDKPTTEWWDEARKFVNSCTPEGLRLIRIMAASELEKRLAQWDNKVEASLQKSKVSKAKAIKRKTIKKAEI
jgi:hypothetical protein